MTGNDRSEEVELNSFLTEFSDSRIMRLQDPCNPSKQRSFFLSQQKEEKSLIILEHNHKESVRNDSFHHCPNKNKLLFLKMLRIQVLELGS